MQKKFHVHGTKSHGFQIKDAVCVKNQNWLPGHVQEVRSPVTYTVLLHGGCVMKGHVDHIFSITVNIDVQPDDAVHDFYPLVPSNWSSTTSVDVPSVTMISS